MDRSSGGSSGWNSRGDRGHRPRRGGGGRGRGRYRGQGQYRGEGRYTSDDGRSGAYGGREDYGGGGSMSAGKAKYGQQGKRDHSAGRGRGRPPPGLRGRDIGLWYASRQTARSKEVEKENTTQINIDSNQERQITNLLANIRSSETVPSQPSRSYADPFEDVEEDFSEDVSRTQNSGGGSSYHPPDRGNSKNNSSRSGSDFFQNDQPINASTARDSSGSYSAASSFDRDRGHPSRETDPQSSSSLFEDNRSPTEKTDPRSSSYNKGQKSTTKLTPSIDSSLAGNSSTKMMTATSSAGDDVPLYFVEDNEDEDSSDSDLDDEKLLQMTQEVEQRYQMGTNMSSDFPGEDDNDEGEVEEDGFDLRLYDNEEKEEDSQFLYEFLKHNAANRRITENLSAKEARDYASLQRIPDLDRNLQQYLREKKNNTRYQDMMQFRQRLPSFAMKEKILELVRKNQVVVISGETGCGKTTQVPQFILDNAIERGEGSLCRVVCTQPRRISAISVAERVADERAEGCGSQTVGYQIRLESKQPTKQGSVLYCTTGIMLKWLESDSLLSGTSHVILDEIHERDLHSDFLMIILKDLLPRRPNLKLILMSATLNANMFSQYYHDCPMMNIPGFTYPVKEYLLEDVIQMTRYTSNSGNKNSRINWGKSKEKKQEIREYHDYCDSLRNRNLGDVMKTLDTEKVDADLCSEVVLHIIKYKAPGAILVFVPGWSDIKAVNDGIEQRLVKSSISKSSVRVIPLHSLMPTVNQKEVFQSPPHGVRKIIIATNIAETSITIDDIVYVVDCGKIKMKNFDTENNVQTLMAEWVSHANAKQRRGRAGRVQAGECYHLYSSFHEARLQDYQLPEMLRTRLEELCLQIKILKLGMVEPFVQKAMQPPSLPALKQSLDLLRDLNALDQYEDLTPLGYHLAKMPLDPHSGKMLLYGAMFSCVDPIMTIAASLSFKDAFYVPLGQEKQADARRRELSASSQSDHIMLKNAYRGWERAKSRGSMWQYCKENFLSHNTLQMLSDMRRQFGTLLHEMNFMQSSDPKCPSANRNSDNVRLVKAIVCAGLFPNVARVKTVKSPNKQWKVTKLTTKTDRSVVFHPKSVNANETEFKSQWIVYHLKMKLNKICLFDSTVVSPLSLLFFGGELTVGDKERKMNQEESDDTRFVNLGGHVTMKANRKTFHLVQRLREEFDNLLEYKITHPGVTNWDRKSKEGALLWAIVELIQSERDQPPNFNKPRTKSRDRDRYNRTCDQCGGKGHTGDRCRIGAAT